MGNVANDEEFPEIPDYVPDDLMFQEGPEILGEIELDDEASLADFWDLLKYISSMTPDEKNKLKENLEQMSLDLSLRSENVEKTEVPSDLLFIGSDGRRVVKGLHYSREVLGGDGPVILPVSSPTMIVGAYSDEFVQSDAEEISEQYHTYEEQSEAWERRMTLYAMRIAQRYDEDPPSGIDDFLKNIE